MKKEKNAPTHPNEKKQYRNTKGSFSIVTIITIINLIITTGGYLIYETKEMELNAIHLNIENELRPQEFNNNLKLTLYREVKEAIIKKDSTIQQATLIIVNNILDHDSIFKEKLINILLQSTNSNRLIETQKQLDAFQEAERSIKSDLFTIDIFYLEQNMEKTESLAQTIYSILKQKYPDKNIRKRLLPTSINSKTGYQIGNNQIRYDSDTNEETLANEILAEIRNHNILPNEKIFLKKIQNNTRNYLSIFIVDASYD